MKKLILIGALFLSPSLFAEIIAYKQYNKWIVLGDEGKIVYEDYFISDLQVQKDIFYASQHNYYKVYDAKGSEILSVLLPEEFKISQSFISYSQYGTLYVHDHKGKLLNKFAYVSKSEVGENFYYVSNGAQGKVFNSKGKPIVDLSSGTKVRLYRNVVAIVSSSGITRVVDANGEVLFEEMGIGNLRTSPI